MSRLNIDTVSMILSYTNIDLMDVINIIDIAIKSDVDDDGIDRLRSSITHITVDNIDKIPIIDGVAMFPNLVEITTIDHQSYHLLDIINAHTKLKNIRGVITYTTQVESQLLRVVYEHRMNIVLNMNNIGIIVRNGYSPYIGPNELLKMYGIMSSMKLGEEIDIDDLILYGRLISDDRYSWMGRINNDEIINVSVDNDDRMPLLSDYHNLRYLTYLGDRYNALQIERMYPSVQRLRYTIVHSYNDLPINPVNMRMIDSAFIGNEEYTIDIYYYEGMWYTYTDDTIGINGDLLTHRAIDNEYTVSDPDVDDAITHLLILEPLVNYDALEWMDNIVYMSLPYGVSIVDISIDAPSIYQRFNDGLITITSRSST